MLVDLVVHFSVEVKVSTALNESINRPLRNGNQTNYCQHVARNRSFSAKFVNFRIFTAKTEPVSNKLPSF